jgi:hypothetical protein
MSRQRVWLLGLGLVLALGAATVLCQADEPKKDAGKKDLTAEDMDRALEEIALAYRLADAGRKAGSPEALLGAAKLLSKLNGKDIGLVKLEGVKPVTLKRGALPKAGQPVKEEGGTPTDFEAEIKKLKDTARTLNRPRDEVLAALIDKVPEKRPPGERGSLKGPKWMGPFTIPPSPSDYYQKSWTFTFRGGEPARVLVRNLSHTSLNLSVCRQIYPDDTALTGEEADKFMRERPDLVQEITGTGDLEVRWRPQETGKFFITVSNMEDEEQGGKEAQLELFKN